jgi:hypothetical protein
MIPPPSSVELEELVLLAGIGALSYCAVELVRILGPAIPSAPTKGRPVPEHDARPFRSPVRAVGAAILATGLAAGGIRLWSPLEWSHLALALTLGLLLVVLLVALTFIARATVQHRVRQSIDRIDASNAFLAGLRGTAALGLGAAGLTLLVTLAGFLALQGLDPPLVGAVFVVWAAAAGAGFARRRAPPSDGRTRRRGGPVLETSALFLAAVTLPMVLAYSDPLVLSLVAHATLLGPTLGGLSIVVAGVSAIVVRSRPERARADSFSRGLLGAGATAVLGVMFLIAWLLDFDLVYFAVLIAGVGLALALASGGAWLATHPDGHPRSRFAVIGAMGLAVPAVAGGVFWLGGFSGWPSSTVWNGSLGLFAVALACLSCAVLGPALLVLGLAETEVPAEVDGLPPDPLDPLHGAWRATARTSGRTGERALGTYLLGATALLVVTFLATDVPLVAGLVGTGTSTILTPSSWTSSRALLGGVVGSAAGFLMSASFAGRFAPPTRPGASFARRTLAHPAVVVGLALGLATATALAGGPWITFGLIPGALGGAALEMVLHFRPFPLPLDAGPSDRYSLATDTDSLAAVAFLSTVPLLLSAAAYVALLFAPLIHWSPA